VIGGKIVVDYDSLNITVRSLLQSNAR